MSSITHNAIQISWKQKLYGYFALARISNSPTVVSNVLAGAALAGALTTQNLPVIALIAVAMVAFYTAGMYLNDLCDYQFDRAKRPDRPLVMRLVSRTSAANMTISLFGIGLLILAAIGMYTFLAGLLLVGLIVAYDVWHKTNPLSPLLMASTRVMVYVIAYLAFEMTISSKLIVAAALLLSYVMGLTSIAKHETSNALIKYWPLVAVFLPVLYFIMILSNPISQIFLILFAVWTLYSLSFIYRKQNRSIGGGISRLIAGISLYDSLNLVESSTTSFGLIAVFTCVLSRFLQQYIKGT